MMNKKIVKNMYLYGKLLHDILRRYDILRRSTTVPWIFNIYDSLRHCDIVSVIIRISSTVFHLEFIIKNSTGKISIF